MVNKNSYETGVLRFVKIIVFIILAIRISKNIIH